MYHQLYYLHCTSCYVIAHSAIELISLMIIRFMFGCQDQWTSLKWLALTGRSCACVGRMARRAPWRQRLPRRWARRKDTKRVAVGFSWPMYGANTCVYRYIMVYLAYLWVNFTISLSSKIRRTMGIPLTDHSSMIPVRSQWKPWREWCIIYWKERTE